MRVHRLGDPIGIGINTLRNQWSMRSECLWTQNVVRGCHEKEMFLDATKKIFRDFKLQHLLKFEVSENWNMVKK